MNLVTTFQSFTYSVFNELFGMDWNQILEVSQTNSERGTN